VAGVSRGGKKKDYKGGNIGEGVWGGKKNLWDLVFRHYSEGWSQGGTTKKQNKNGGGICWGIPGFWAGGGMEVG